MRKTRSALTTKLHVPYMTSSRFHDFFVPSRYAVNLWVLVGPPRRRDVRPAQGYLTIQKSDGVPWTWSDPGQSWDQYPCDGGYFTGVVAFNRRMDEWLGEGAEDA